MKTHVNDKQFLTKNQQNRLYSSNGRPERQTRQVSKNLSSNSTTSSSKEYQTNLSKSKPSRNQAGKTLHYSKYPTRSKFDINKVIYNAKTKESFFMCDFLGKGGFAKVYKTRCIDNEGYIQLDKTCRATKVVEKKTVAKSHQRDKMKMEIEIHASLEHENIVQFYCNFTDSERIYVVLELCECCSLMELQKRRVTISQPELRYFMKQIFRALNYLHKNYIIHRDLKLANVLLAKQMRVKLADFGLATKVGAPNGQQKRSTLCGTPNYIAPEILNKVGHGKPVDVWSSGCIMYALLVGQPPFETSSIKSTYLKIKQNSYLMPRNIKNTTAGKIIELMLAPRQEQRPDIIKLLNHPFITKGYCPSSLPDSAMTTLPAFGDEQASFYEMPEAKGDHDYKRVRPGALYGESKLISRRYISQEGRICNKYLDQSMSNADEILQIQQNSIESRSSRQPLLEVDEGRNYNIKSSNRPPNQPISTMESLYNEWRLSVKETMRQLLFFKKWQEISLKRLKVNDQVNMDDAVEPNRRPVYWISKWVDYSDKYGFGYALIDESVGVLFNDNKRLILHKNKAHLQYIPADFCDEKLIFAKDIKRNSPLKLYKNLRLLKHFSEYMEENLIRTGEEDIVVTEVDSMRRLPFLIKWFRTNQAIIFMLSNKAIQINFFSCHSKLVFDPTVESVSVIETENDGKTKKAMITYGLEKLESTGVPPDLFERIMYSFGSIQKLYQNMKPDSGITGQLVEKQK